MLHSKRVKQSHEAFSLPGTLPRLPFTLLLCDLPRHIHPKQYPECPSSSLLAKWRSHRPLYWLGRNHPRLLGSGLQWG